MTVVQKGFKFRLYPNKEQKVLIAKTIGCGRFVFNHFLSLWNKTYQETGKGLSYAKCSAACTLLKESIPWLKEVDAHALQSSLRDLGAAFDQFFKKQNAYPRFKKKNGKVQSYRTNIEKNNQLSHVSIKGNRLKLPKLGWIRYANSQEIEGRLINATIRRTPSGKYFVSLLVETAVQPFDKTESVIGIDVGLATFATISDGTVYKNPRFFKKLKKSFEKSNGFFPDECALPSSKNESCLRQKTIKNKNEKLPVFTNKWSIYEPTTCIKYLLNWSKTTT